MNDPTTYNPNDDPTRIYSAVWYAKCGITVLRHDRRVIGIQHTEERTHERDEKYAGSPVY